jgi:chloramphenicol 3-O phosphotransferase
VLDTKSFLLGSIFVIFFLIFYVYKSQERAKPAGIVLILNGPSASGKSSIQKAFQSLMMPDLWIKHGIDSLFDGPLPDITPDNLEYWQTKNAIRWVTTTKDKDNNNVIPLFIGDQGDKVAYGMNSAIFAYAQNGNNVIVDYIAYKKEWLDDLRKKKPENINIYYIKVNIPLEILEQREKNRGTSPVGHARSHYDIIDWDISYDLEIDSGTESPEQIAEKIKTFISEYKF